MFTSPENRLWLAVHLLYPSSSQAFDIYQAVSRQAEDAMAKENLALVFFKLLTAFEKIPAISLNLSFYEFEFDQIDQWKIIYKNSQKNQLLIFVGVLIFELKIGDIASQLRLPGDKAQFQFHQMFKKLVKNNPKIKYNDQLSLKKQDDLKISYLYTYENLIEYCLGQLSDEDAAKVKTGLDLYPTLQIAKDEYLKIINQIQNLKVQRSNSIISKSRKKLTLVGSEAIKDETGDVGFFKQNKKMLALAFFVLIITIASLFKFSDIFDRFGRSEKMIVMQTVEKPREIISSQPAIALESLPKQSEPPPTSSASHNEMLAVAVSPPVEPVAVQKPKIEAKSKIEAEPKTAVKPAGGLYRASLKVKDLGLTNKKLLAKLISLGAKKAGEVELGWLKSNNTAYYHYTIPEKSIEQANGYFKEVGTLNIKFEPHPRLIPAGSKRFIVEIKSDR